MHKIGHPGYDDDSQYPEDETPFDYARARRRRRREVARLAGRLADVVVNRKTITQAQKDEVVQVLRDCERELIACEE
jgi:hypothetical protein